MVVLLAGPLLVGGPAYGEPGGGSGAAASAQVHATAAADGRGPRTSMQDLAASLRKSTESLVGRLIYGALLLFFCTHAVLLLAAGALPASISAAAERVRALRSSEGLNNATADAVGDILAPLQIIGEQWEEFRETFVEIDGRLFNCHQSDQFLRDADVENAAGILGGRLPLRAVHTFPGILTSLGLLGTFFGIAEGLGRLAEIPSGVNADLGAPVAGVVIGLSSAFWTSIFGLLSGLIAGGWANWHTQRRQRALGSLRQELDRLVQRVNSEALLALLVRSGTGEGAERRDAALADRIGTGVGEAVRDQIVPALDRMTDVVEDQVTRAAKRGDEAARAFSKQMVAHLTTALTDSLKDASRSVLSFGTRVESAAGSLSESVANTGALLERQRAVLASMVDERETGQAGAAEAAGELKQVGATFSRKLTLSLKRLDTSLEGTQAAYEAAQLLHEAQAEHVARLQVQLTELSGHVARTAQSYAATVERLGGLLGTTEGRLDSGVEQLGAAAAALSAHGQGEQERAAAYERLLKGYETTLALLARIQEGGQETDKRLTAHLETIGAHGDALRALYKRSNDEQEVLRAVATALAAQLEEGMRRGMSAPLDRVERAAAALAAAAQHLGPGPGGGAAPGSRSGLRRWFS